MMAMERSRRQPSGYVLVITNHASDARTIRESLLAVGPEPLPVEWVSTLSEGLDRLQRLSIEAVILDLCLPDSHGIETFDKVSTCAPGVPVLVLSDSSEEEVAKEAVHRGDSGLPSQGSSGCLLASPRRSYRDRLKGCGRDASRRQGTSRGNAQLNWRRCTQYGQPGERSPI